MPSSVAKTMPLGTGSEVGTDVRVMGWRVSEREIGACRIFHWQVLELPQFFI